MCSEFLECKHSVVNELNKRRLILASSSPRRVEIFKNVGLKFEQIPSKFLEDYSKDNYTRPEEYAKHTTIKKAREIFKSLEDKTNAIVVAADTIIIKDGVIHEKPKTKEKAVETLLSLSDKEHYVCTAVSILFNTKDGEEGTEKELCFTEHTGVKMCKISKEDAIAYAETNIPLDKAGSYAYQRGGGLFISSIHGCYYNVIGFPINRFILLMGQLIEYGEV